MLIKNSLKEIEALVRELKNKEVDERQRSYDTIAVLLTQIEESVDLQKYPNYPIYKNDLLEMCKALCGFVETEGREEAQLIGASILALRKMGSYTCFNVDGHYI